MAINKLRYYVGPLGYLQAFPAMTGSDHAPEAPITIPGGVHTSQSGRTTMDRVGTPKRSWVLDWPNLTDANRVLIDAAIHRSANAPLRLIDPRNTNKLTADTSAGGSLSLSTTPWTTASIVTDAAGTPTSNTWGNTDTGQPWVNGGGAAGDYSKSSGLARQSLGSVNVARSNSLQTVIVKDFLYVDDIATDKLATGASQASSILARHNGSTTFYQARIQFHTTAFLFVELIKVVAGVATTMTSLMTTVAHVANTRYNRKFECAGTTIRFKVWKVGDPEPALWTLSAIDSSVPAAGFFILESVLFTGNTSALPVVVSVDNLSITSTPSVAFSQASVPSVFSGVLAGGLDLQGWFLDNRLTATAEKIPILAGSTYRFSIYAKGTAQFKLTVRPFDVAGTEQTLVTGSTETPTGAWTRYEYLYTPSAGHVAAYVGLVAQASGNLQTTAWWVAIDQAFSTWSFGVGCPTVVVLPDIGVSNWRAKFQRMSLTLRES